MAGAGEPQNFSFLSIDRENISVTFNPALNGLVPPSNCLNVLLTEDSLGRTGKLLGGDIPPTSPRHSFWSLASHISFSSSSSSSSSSSCQLTVDKEISEWSEGTVAVPWIGGQVESLERLVVRSLIN